MRSSFVLRVVLGTSALVALPALSACSAARGGERAQVARQATEPRTGDATAATPPAAIPVSTPMLTAGSKTAPAPAPTPAPTDTSSASAAPPPRPAVPESTEEPKRIGARHVLVQWMGSDRAGKSVLRTREQALVLAQEVLRRARAGEDLGRLAVEYSDEPNAGARGGSLGRFSKGQMVGAFEAVAFKLKVGQISEIVETPFGYHIIQRTE
jgi:hypothetical protein